MYLSSVWSALVKGLNAYLNNRFHFLIFNTFAQVSRNFTLSLLCYCTEGAWIFSEPTACFYLTGEPEILIHSLWVSWSWTWWIRGPSREHWVWGGNPPWMGCQSNSELHAHTFTIGEIYLYLAHHLLACFWEAGDNPHWHRKNMHKNLTQTVTCV